MLLTDVELSEYDSCVDAWTTELGIDAVVSSFLAPSEALAGFLAMLDNPGTESHHPRQRRV